MYAHKILTHKSYHCKKEKVKSLQRKISDVNM